MTKTILSPIDRFIVQFDKALRTLAPSEYIPERPSPASGLAESPLTDEQQRHAAGLMRVNHSGEVCAQALYQGQALTAKLPQVRQEMDQAANEEVDHLLWCAQRLEQLDSHPSLLNPLWYGLSFTIGATAGLLGDEVSLGFVAATENQVCQHLESHLQELPQADNKSREIVQQMLVDETKHAHTALEAGGVQFPRPIKNMMSLIAKVMTNTSYHF